MPWILLAVILLSSCTGEEAPPDDSLIETPPIHTPRWAFEPWISKDISDGPDTYDFVDGFLSRDIPVGVVVIDSPWDVNYTNFRPHPSRYPDFNRMVSDLSDRGVRVVMWVTQMLNEDSFDLEEGGDTYDGPATTFLRAERDGYLVNGGETYFWWKGSGAGIDFFDEEGLRWYHGLQDDLLDAGISGWKLDFGESYIDTEVIETDRGPVPHQVYSEEYYRDFWSYGVHRRGRDEFVTMVRGYDRSYHFDGRFFARPEHAPVIWAGDNRRDYVGMEDALDHMFRSARAGYVVVGSDIGGYLDRDDADLRTPVPFDEVNFHRWTALGALTPFMQLHGRTNITPWTTARPEDTVRIYRWWSWLHHALVPFFYSLAEEAYAGGENLMRPIGDESEWPGDYRFQVGGALLVAPILDETGVRDVQLPPGRWFDWWDPAGDALEGLIEKYDATDESRIPLFVKEGAIIPMNVENDVNQLGTTASSGHLTVLAWPSEGESGFVLHDEAGPVDITLGPKRLRLAQAPRPLLLRIRTGAPPDAVSDLPSVGNRAALDAAESGWFFEASTRSAWVKHPAATTEVVIAW